MKNPSLPTNRWDRKLKVIHNHVFKKATIHDKVCHLLTHTVRLNMVGPNTI